MAKLEPDLLLRFTPHIPRRRHANGWTADRQIAFIDALARTGVIAEAARSVGMSPRSAYSLRATVRNRYSNWADVPMTPERAASLGPGYVYSFAAAWDKALSRGIEMQMEVAAPLAIEGEQVPIIRRGRIIGWQTRYNTRLTIAALGAHRRYHEGPSFDHDHRIAERTLLMTEKIERLLRVGPIRWPDSDTAAGPPEDPDMRRARQRHERKLDRLYGPPLHGIRDPMRPAGTPMRTLAEQEAALRRRRRPPPAPPEAVEPRIRAL